MAKSCLRSIWMAPKFHKLVNFIKVSYFLNTSALYLIAEFQKGQTFYTISLIKELRSRTIRTDSKLRLLTRIDFNVTHLVSLCPTSGAWTYGINIFGEFLLISICKSKFNCQKLEKYARNCMNSGYCLSHQVANFAEHFCTNFPNVCITN